MSKRGLLDILLSDLQPFPSITLQGHSALRYRRANGKGGDPERAEPLLMRFPGMWQTDPDNASLKQEDHPLWSVFSAKASIAGTARVGE